VSDRADLRALKRAHEEANRITVGELREHLAAFDADFELSFGAVADGENPVLFRRVKLRGPSLVCIELDELTDETMEDELAWAWVRRVGELRDAILFVAGEVETPRPTKAETAALKAIVAELKADPVLLEAADGFVFSLDQETNTRATRALQTVARWAGLRD